MSDTAEKSTVSNLTPYRIAIKSASDAEEKLVVPAFGERKLSAEEIARFQVPRWEQANLVRVRSAIEDKTILWGELIKISLFVFGAVAMAVGGIVNEKPKEGSSQGPISQWIRDHSGPLLGWSLLALLAAIGLLAIFVKDERRRQVLRGLLQGIFGMLTMVVAVGGALFAIFWTGKGFNFWDGAGYPVTLGRMVQFVFISIAAITPAALFFLFDRQRLRTLREGFFRDVTRLDPQVRSLDDAESIYGARVSEVYGDPDNVGRGRIGGQKRGPVIIATILITAGWLLALRVGRDASSMNVLDWFRPNPTPMVFGFLGAYFFGLNMLFHRYTRSDLKPKAYSHLTVRILTVCTLCWTLPLLPEMFGRVEPDAVASLAEAGSTNAVGAARAATPLTNGLAQKTEVPPTPAARAASEGTPVWVLVLAFIVGVFPQTGLNLMFEMLRESKRLRKAMPSLHEKQTLNELEGVSLYDRTRLLEEGIENIENLAHHDLIDLVLHTRIPVPRLVDWVDQAVLYLHLGIVDTEAADTGEAGVVPAQPPGQPRVEPVQDIGRRNLQILRQHGIRNATSLMRAVDVDEEARKRLLTLLGQVDGGSPRLAVILRTVSGEQWMPHLRQWRKFGEQKDETRGFERFEQDWKQSEEKGKPATTAPQREQAGSLTQNTTAGASSSATPVSPVQTNLTKN